jgi:hypothetical protein
VSASSVIEWCNKLPTILKEYKKDDWFNADETNVFFRAPPTRSIVRDGEPCRGLKKKKERITVLFCCSATGQKLPPLVIGRYKKPRCFRNNDPSGLGIRYEANRKAWMTRDIFSNWLLSLNNRFISEKRNILLFLDNCTAHPAVTLSNIKLVFLPPNTTSNLQPLDMGIIRAVKMGYRRKLLSYVANFMDEPSNAESIFSKVRSINK